MFYHFYLFKDMIINKNKGTPGRHYQKPEEGRGGGGKKEEEAIYCAKKYGLSQANHFHYLLNFTRLHSLTSVIWQKLCSLSQ